MPGSCDSEQSSSPSLISSLRRFRFQNKSKQSQPEDTTQSSSSAGQSTLNAEQDQAQKSSSSAYSPLSYRKYENPNDSLVLLKNLSRKIQVLFKNNTTNSVLELTLTTEETKKLKETVLQQSSISVKWSTNVTEYTAEDLSGKVLKIKRIFLYELSKYLIDVLNDKFSKNNSIECEKQPIKTYSRGKKSESATNQTKKNNPLPPESQTQGAMDDYEEFCEKEQCLRKMLDAFPWADIMEAQDMLVKCQWNLKKAMLEAQSQPLKPSSRKRGAPGAQPAPAANLANQKPENNTPLNTSLPKKFPEEIVLDSSDEDEMNGKNFQPSNSSDVCNDSSTSSTRPAKRARRVISSDSDDDDDTTSAVEPPVNTSCQKSQLTVSPLPQNASLSVQPSTSQKASSSVSSVTSQKPSLTVQSVIPQKANSSVSSIVSQKPGLSVQSVAPPLKSNSSASISVQQKASSSVLSIPVQTSNNQNCSSIEKTINVPQALSIKPVPVSLPSNVEKVSSPMPSLPKGLVITQVKGADSLLNKSENEGMSLNGTHPVSIPTNSSKPAQLVRIKTSSDVSISASNSNQSALSSNKTVGKGVSITPVSQTFNIIPKTLSVTPVTVGLSKELSIKDKSIISSSEDESSSDMKFKPNSSTVKNIDVEKFNLSKHLEESNTSGQSCDSEMNKVERKKEVINLHKSKSGKRKKLHLSDEDDDEEYGNEDIYDSEDSDCEENLTSAHSAVLKFFQDSSVEELGSIPGCSKRKIEALVNIRPFSKWSDLVDKLKNDKTLSTDLLNGAKKVLDMRNAIAKLMNRCQRISLDMEDLVENLKENNETSSDYVSKQPELLNERMHLTAYQMLGLNWLLLMHNQQVNAILADEMGLGKTVQAIAFLAYLKQIEEEGPHLIVVPSSTLDNWRKELETWWPSVSVICYHGGQESRRELRLQILNDEVEEFDIVITTYNMVTSSAEDRNFFKRLEFNYVVFDEAHMLKNMASQRYASLMRIKAPRRLLLTGTPLQNNLVELMSLLIFAMPHMFSGKTEQIKQMFSSVSKATGNKNRYEKDRIEHAKRIMKPFVLRRLKKDVLKELPSKHEETKFCPMVDDQAEKYEALIKKFSAEVQVESSEEKDQSSSGAGMMMQLRRAANHPLLLRRFYDDDKLLLMSKLMLNEPTHTQSDPKIIFEDMSVMSDFELHKLCLQYKSLKSHALPDSAILNSGKFKVLDELLPELIKEDHRILLFSQFTMVLDIVREYMDIKKYKYLRLDGQVPVPERQQLIDEFNNDSDILVFLLSTRAGGLGINLTAADTVILHDIDFNPYNDKQAEDRCHRVGQVRDVNVIRLISEKTIEEGILQRAREKLKLEKDIHDDGDDEENDSSSVAMLLRDALGLKSTKS